MVHFLLFFILWDLVQYFFYKKNKKKTFLYNNTSLNTKRDFIQKYFVIFLLFSFSQTLILIHSLFSLSHSYFTLFFRLSLTNRSPTETLIIHAQIWNIRVKIAYTQHLGSKHPSKDLYGLLLFRDMVWFIDTDPIEVF